MEEKVEVEIFKKADISFNSLEEENIDLLVIPLKKVPTTLPEGLIIAGLTPRNHYQEVLFIHPEAFDRKKILRLKEQSIISTYDIRQSIQLRSMRDDLNIEIHNPDVSQSLSLLKAGSIDACLLSESDLVWMQVTVSDYYTIKIHASELVPAPGEGTLAFITFRDNIALRRLIKQVHHKETALCTNVERRFVKRFKGHHSDIGAYCYRDSAGFFHAYASMKDQKEKAIHVSCSQSTHLELDSKLYDLLIQKAQY
jgi:porphobilinogen deaminase